MKRHMLISAVLAILLLIPATARADGLTNIGHSTSSDGTFFDIATFSQNAEMVGLLGISHKVCSCRGMPRFDVLVPTIVEAP